MKKNPASIDRNATASAEQSTNENANAAENIFHSKSTEKQTKEEKKMKMKQRAAMYQQIESHGKNLLAIFPNATEHDPVKLCKRLRLAEGEAARIALQLCNGPEFAGGYEEADAKLDAILARVNKLLGNVPPRVPVFINRDPRGYALKIREIWMRNYSGNLHRDWGGYGILAPDFTPVQD